MRQCTAQDPLHLKSLQQTLLLSGSKTHTHLPRVLKTTYRHQSRQHACLYPQASVTHHQPCTHDMAPHTHKNMILTRPPLPHPLEPQPFNGIICSVSKQVLFWHPNCPLVETAPGKGHADLHLYLMSICYGDLR